MTEESTGGTIASDSLSSIVYTSVAREQLSQLALEALLDQSRTSNTKRGITGMLLYRSGRFFQVLEGPTDEVESLASLIARDPRHENMRIIMTQPIEHREFADWSMGYESIRPSQGEAPSGFRDTFDDLDLMDDKSAVARAVRELTLWFRVRSAVSPDPAPRA